MIVEFGKYQGQTIAQVASKDYSYAVWAAREITNTEIKAAFVDEIKKPVYKNEAVKPFIAAVEKYKKKMRGAFCPAEFQKSQGDSIFSGLGLEKEIVYNTTMFDLISDWILESINELNGSDKIALGNFAVWAVKIDREGIAAIINRLPAMHRSRIAERVIYADEIKWHIAKLGGLETFKTDKFKNWQAIYNAMPVN